MGEREFELDNLPDAEQITDGDLAKFETDPDYIAFRDGTEVSSGYKPSQEKIQKMVKNARNKWHAENGL